MEWYKRLPQSVKHFFVPRPWLIKEGFVLDEVSWTIMINTISFAYNCGPLWHRVFVLGHVLILDLGIEPDIYVDEYLWTLRPHNSPSKSCFLAPRAERRILIFSGMFWVRRVLSSTSTLLTLWSLECAFIKFWLLFVPHVLCCDVDWMAKNPIRIGAGIFPLEPFFLWYK